MSYLGYDSIKLIHGSDLDTKTPFVDLRKKDGAYTVNAVLFPYEYELEIGKRYIARTLPAKIQSALEGLSRVISRSDKDNDYKESIRIGGGW